ncbi:hypothetical protein BHE90_003431 [Fusarium euwallaceae]|uniref:Uncharacterized protein n=3 Tax=Fusarium solani species complex TaxID=232080 RepID=A0A3M2RXY0_9HYPO|nr:hypothetical protein CDV36_010266 [Fusarium kuroshium]RSL77107.1 hypothetical protein CEP51_009358 [Fusarium floridanum]RTE82051.1 hypothetical protein BHE90_003431 [Fusarium euwallaceae]
MLQPTRTNLMPWYRTLSWMAQGRNPWICPDAESPSLPSVLASERALATWINFIPIEEAPCRGNRES